MTKVKKTTYCVWWHLLIKLFAFYIHSIIHLTLIYWSKTFIVYASTHWLNHRFEILLFFFFIYSFLSDFSNSFSNHSFTHQKHSSFYRRFLIYLIYRSYICILMNDLLIKNSYCFHFKFMNPPSEWFLHLVSFTHQLIHPCIHLLIINLYIESFCHFSFSYILSFWFIHSFID